METLRCPTCLTLILDSEEKRCPACHSRLRKRGAPIVLGETTRITNRALLPFEREMRARADAPDTSEKLWHRPVGKTSVSSETTSTSEPVDADSESEREPAPHGKDRRPKRTDKVGRHLRGWLTSVDHDITLETELATPTEELTSAGPVDVVATEHNVDADVASPTLEDAPSSTGIDLEVEPNTPLAEPEPSHIDIATERRIEPALSDASTEISDPSFTAQPLDQHDAPAADVVSPTLEDPAPLEDAPPSTIIDLGVEANLPTAVEIDSVIESTSDADTALGRWEQLVAEAARHVDSAPEDASAEINARNGGAPATPTFIANDNLRGSIVEPLDQHDKPAADVVSPTLEDPAPLEDAPPSTIIDLEADIPTAVEIDSVIESTSDADVASPTLEDAPSSTGIDLEVEPNTPLAEPEPSHIDIATERRIEPALSDASTEISDPSFTAQPLDQHDAPAADVVSPTLEDPAPLEDAPPSTIIDLGVEANLPTAVEIDSVIESTSDADVASPTLEDAPSSTGIDLEVEPNTPLAEPEPSHIDIATERRIEPALSDASTEISDPSFTAQPLDQHDAPAADVVSPTLEDPAPSTVISLPVVPNTPDPSEPEPRSIGVAIEPITQNPPQHMRGRWRRFVEEAASRAATSAPPQPSDIDFAAGPTVTPEPQPESPAVSVADTPPATPEPGPRTPEPQPELPAVSVADTPPATPEPGPRTPEPQPELPAVSVAETPPATPEPGPRTPEPQPELPAVSVAETPRRDARSCARRSRYWLVSTDRRGDWANGGGCLAIGARRLGRDRSFLESDRDERSPSSSGAQQPWSTNRGLGRVCRGRNRNSAGVGSAADGRGPRHCRRSHGGNPREGRAWLDPAPERGGIARTGRWCRAHRIRFSVGTDAYSPATPGRRGHPCGRRDRGRTRRP